MKKEIIFRGKSMCDVGFIYGDLIHKRNGLIMIQDENGLGTDVDEETIGQFTGLKDKNGVDIYEGDIIKTFHYHSGKINYYLYHAVVWSDIYNGWFTKGVGELETKDNEKDGGIQLFVYLRSIYGRYSNNCFEVIGNIYDNKELINK